MFMFSVILSNSRNEILDFEIWEVKSEVQKGF